MTQRNIIIQRELQRAFAECIGTFILVLTHAGLGIAFHWTDERLDFSGAAVGIGFSLVGLIYAFGDVSGAHFNPNVSLAFALRGVFRWKRLVYYIVFQFIGGYLAATVLYSLFGRDTDHMGSNRAIGISLWPQAFVLELISTWILITFILRICNRGHVVGSEAGVAVGFTIGLLSLFAGNFGVGSMNMIRTLSVATFSGLLHEAGVLIGAQLIGLLLAVVCSCICDTRDPARIQEQQAIVRGDAPNV